MFCTEPIKKVYYLGPPDRDSDSNCFLCFCPCMEFHTTDGRWLILQTERYYIKIGTDGVSLEPDLAACGFCEDDFLDPDHWSPDDEDTFFTSLETTVFSGERLLLFQQKENGLLIRFDHFVLDVFFYTAKNFPWNLKQSQYIPIPALDHHLTRICDCGGKGRGMYEMVYDLIVRCDRCHRSTCATFAVQDVIDDWNGGDTPITVTTAEEDFRVLSGNPIDRIAISRRYTKCDENLFDCESMMLVMGEHIFEISSHLITKDIVDFSLQRCSSYNPEHWPFVICSTEEAPVIFLGKETGENRYPALRYRFGNKELILTADGEGSITFGWVHREGMEPDGRSPFNEILA